MAGPTLLVLSLIALLPPRTLALVVQLDTFGDHSIRIRQAPDGGSIVEPPLQALNDGGPERTTTVHMSATGPNAQLVNGNLLVTADASGLVTASRVSDGKVLLQQTLAQWGAPAVGSRAGSVSALVSFAGHGSAEKIYGLGEHSTGSVSQFPYFKLLQNSQAYDKSHGSDVSIPFYSSSEGFGFVWNLPSYGWVNLTAEGHSWYSNATLNADYWITTTSPSSEGDPSHSPYADLLRHMVDAVGHAAPLPDYALGFIQSKDRYNTQAQLLAVARGYFDRGLPLSMIVIDWQHYVHMGDWSLDPRCWPSPQEMTDELAELGIELMITMWPQQSVQSQWYPSFAADGYLATALNGSAQHWENTIYLYDATNPYSREFTFDCWWKGYGQYNVRAVWLDAAEPERFVTDPSPDPPMGSFRLSAGTDTEIGMAWVQQHARTFAEGFARHGIGAGEFFLLPRSAWAGSWKYGASLWSGDIQSTFAELQMQVKVAQGVAMSGVIGWTTDIGGYFHGNPADPVFQNLIVRWFQFGALCPLMRLHGHRDGGPPPDPTCKQTNGDNEVWNLAPEPAHYNAIAAVLRLREALRGYLRMLNAEAVETGMPMLRPMFLQFPADATAQTTAVETQFMLGPDWLISPVTANNVSTWSAYLPALGPNETWIYHWNETDLGHSGGWVSIDVSAIGDFPLFVRRPVAPVPPVVWANGSSLWSDRRSDQVLCVTEQCWTSNLPPTDSYVVQRLEGWAVTSSGTDLIINGTTYSMNPLTLYFSSHRQDNLVCTNASSSIPAEYHTTIIQNGYVLKTQAPGSLPLQVWFKSYNATHQDYATVAAADGIAWAQSHNYTYQWTTGYVFLTPPSMLEA